MPDDQDYDTPKKQKDEPTVKEAMAMGAVEEKTKNVVVNTVVFAQDHKIEIFAVTTTVLLLGILRSNRKAAKYIAKVTENHYSNAYAMRRLIEELRVAGHPFTYYPGLGVYVESN